MKENESIEWIGFSPSGRKIGRIVHPAGTAKYVTMDKTKEEGNRIEVIYDSRHVTEDVLYAITLNFSRLTCILERQIWENPKGR